MEDEIILSWMSSLTMSSKQGISPHFVSLDEKNFIDAQAFYITFPDDDHGDFFEQQPKFLYFIDLKQFYSFMILSYFE